MVHFWRALEARFDRVYRRMEQLGLARPEIVPQWASLLSLPTPQRFPPLNLPPARQREETYRLMLDWLHIRAPLGPVLFVIEDQNYSRRLVERSKERVINVPTVNLAKTVVGTSNCHGPKPDNSRSST